jgi:hypothetical protein
MSEAAYADALAKVSANKTKTPSWRSLARSPRVAPRIVNARPRPMMMHAVHQYLL